jgi:hypothetical protein
MADSRRFLRDLAMLILGAAGGYSLARHRGGRLPLPNGVADLPHRIQRYQQTHPNEVLIGAALVAVILFLAFGNRSGGKKGKR